MCGLFTRDRTEIVIPRQVHRKPGLLAVVVGLLCLLKGLAVEVVLHLDNSDGAVALFGYD